MVVMKLGQAAVTGLSVFALLGAGQALFGPSLPDFQQTYGLPPSQAGLILSAYWIGGLLGVSLTLVPSLARFMRWRVGGAVLVLLLGAGLIGGGSVWLLALAGASLMGAGHGLLTVGLNGFFASSFGARTPMMINLLNALFGVGAVAGPILIVAVGGDAETAFLCMAVLFAAAFIPALLFDDRLVRPSGERMVGLANTARRHWFFLLSMGLAVGLEVAIVGWGATVLSSSGYSLDEARAFTSLFYLAFTAARLSAVGLALRVAPPHFVVAGLGLAFLMLLGAQDGAYAGYVFAAIGFAVGPLFPNLFAWAAPAIAKEPTLSGLVICCGMLGGIVVPAILSVLVGWLGAGSVFYLLAGLAFAGLLLAVRQVVRMRVPRTGRDL